MYKILLFLFPVVVFAEAVGNQAIDEAIEQLEESKRTVIELLDATAKSLGLDNINELELCRIWRETFYEIVRKKFVVDEEGWVYLGVNEMGEAEWMKYDEFCNVHKKVIAMQAGTPDTGALQRAEELPPAPSPTTRFPTGYAFLGFLISSFSSIFLLYGTVDALLKKQLLQAFTRGILFFILSAVSFYLFQLLI